MTIEEMVAREEIRVLLASYNIGGDRGRIDDLVRCFTLDGVLVRRVGTERHPIEGAAAITAALSKPRRASGVDPAVKVVVRHNLTTSEIIFEGPDKARGRTYFFVVSEIGPDHCGVYVDEYRKLDGHWKIARREARLDWAAPNGHAQQTLNELSSAH
jgi:hypothetical protein